MFWLVSTLAFRSAILLLYLELFGASRNFRYCVYALQTLIVLFYVGATATSLDLHADIRTEEGWTLLRGLNDRDDIVFGGVFGLILE